MHKTFKFSSIVSVLRKFLSFVFLHLSFKSIFILRKVLSTLKIFEHLLPVDDFDVFAFSFPTAKSSDRRKIVLAVGYKIPGGKQTCFLKTFISDFPGNFLKKDICP